MLVTPDMVRSLYVQGADFNFAVDGYCPVTDLLTPYQARSRMIISI